MAITATTDQIEGLEVRFTRVNSKGVAQTFGMRPGTGLSFAIWDVRNPDATGSASLAWDDRTQRYDGVSVQFRPFTVPAEVFDWMVGLNPLMRSRVDDWQKRYPAAATEAKASGKPVCIGEYVQDCCARNLECDTDIVTLWVHPDGHGSKRVNHRS